MWNYEKRLQFPVKIDCTSPAAAKVIITQLGGPDGEMAAAMRYLNQRYAMPNRHVAGLLTDIGTEDASWTFTLPSGKKVQRNGMARRATSTLASS